MASTSKKDQTNASTTSADRMAAAAAAGSTTTAVNPDKAIARLLYAMLKQKSLKDIDWNQVASDPVLLESISNGHAARMRYSRFRNSVENCKPTKRQPKQAADAAQPALASAASAAASASSMPSRTKAAKVTKRRSVGARKVQPTAHDNDNDNDATESDGDTEVDSDLEEDTRRCISKQRATERKPVLLPPKEEPGLVNAQLSFSSLPSPPQEAGLPADFDESPLVEQAPFFAPLIVNKKRKKTAHSPSDETAALHHIPQAYGVPGMGFSPAGTRYHSMPLMSAQQQQQQQHCASLPGTYGGGGALMMRHHSAGSVSRLAGPDPGQHLAVPSNAYELRTRLLTPTQDDQQQQQQQLQFNLQQQNHHQQHHQQQLQQLYQDHPLQPLAIGDFLGFAAPAGTPHPQWTPTPFASPPLGDTLDNSTVDMSPYMGADLDFSVAGPVVPANTSLFAMVDTVPPPMPSPSSNQHLSHAFAKHSNNWNAMISQSLDPNN